MIGTPYARSRRALACDERACAWRGLRVELGDACVDVLTNGNLHAVPEIPDTRARDQEISGDSTCIVGSTDGKKRWDEELKRKVVDLDGTFFAKTYIRHCQDINAKVGHVNLMLWPLRALKSQPF